jgi:outer membrane protein assembly factor BamB
LVTAWDSQTLVPRWTKDLGESSIGETSMLMGVAGELVLVTPGTDRVVALDALSGEIVWEVPIQGFVVGVAPDPDTRRWYVTTDFECDGCTEPPLVTALDVETGMVIWTSEGEVRTTWQWADPAVFPGMVVVMDVPGYRQECEPEETARLRAFDSSTGARLWATDLDSPSEAFSDHLLMHDVERRILVASTPDGSVFSIDPATGDVLWRADTGFARILEIEEDAVVLEWYNPRYLDLETGQPR